MIQVFYSPESRMVKGALKKSLKALYPELTPMNYVSLDMGTSLLSDLAMECLSLPLGTDKKAVVADNCFFLESHKTRIKYQKDDKPAALLDYLSHPDPSIDLFLLVYSETLDLKGEFFPLLDKAGAKISAVLSLTPSQWSAFIPNYFEKRGYTIDPSAASLLLGRIQNDYSRFLNEAQKLLAYSLEEKRINEQDVRTLVASPLEDDAFILSNAICQGNIAKAISIYNNLKGHSSDEVYLLHMLSNQFRFLNQLDFLLREGLNENAIASSLHCSLGRIRASQYSLRKMKEGDIAKTLEKLYEAESSIMKGKMGAPMAFSLFLASYSL